MSTPSNEIIAREEAFNFAKWNGLRGSTKILLERAFNAAIDRATEARDEVIHLLRQERALGWAQFHAAPDLTKTPSGKQPQESMSRHMTKMAQGYPVEPPAQPQEQWTYLHAHDAEVRKPLVERAERAEMWLKDKVLPFSQIKGFIETFTFATPASYAQRTPLERELYQLWVTLKIKIEKQIDAALAQVGEKP